MKTLYIFLFVLILQNSALAQETTILQQDQAPISISKFEAKYQEGGTYSNEGIRYDVSFTNATNKQIVAYAFGFYSFDVFNRALGRPLEGFSVDDLKPNDSDDGAWVQRAINSSLFRKYGTAVAYIARVRFKDGTIWKYDDESILKQLQKFESSLTLDDLKSKK